jgi:hypothetical protein
MDPSVLHATKLAWYKNSKAYNFALAGLFSTYGRVTKGVGGVDIAALGIPVFGSEARKTVFVVEGLLTRPHIQRIDRCEFGSGFSDGGVCFPRELPLRFRFCFSEPGS